MRLKSGVVAALVLSMLAWPLSANASLAPPPPEPFVFIGAFFAILIGIMVLFVFLPLGFHIWALVDVSQTKDELFGPPWDNSKQSWMMGLAIGFFVPFGHIIVPVLWWTQVRSPRKRGEPIRRPFWMSAPTGPQPGGYGQRPPGM